MLVIKQCEKWLEACHAPESKTSVLHERCFAEIQAYFNSAIANHFHHIFCEAFFFPLAECKHTLKTFDADVNG